MELEPTGERMITEAHQQSATDHLIYLMHRVSYEWAAGWARSRAVLDFGCGTGHGAAGLAEVASRVVAIDVAPEAIAYAEEHYRAPNLSFRSIDAVGRLPFDDATFDVVTSVQVIEHVADVNWYLSEIRRVLRPRGVLLVATPDRTTRLFRHQRPWNRWHVVEYDGDGLRSALGRHFGDVAISRMSGRPDVVDLELRRCRRRRWLTLPFTVPGVPERWRVGALTLLDRARRARPASGTASPRSFSFGPEALKIADDASPSLVLLAVAAAT